MYKRILLPVDGSEHAKAAVDHALSLASKYEADIHLVHVINTKKYDTSIESQVAPLRQKGEQYIGEVLPRIEDAGIPVTSSIEMGRPGPLLLEYVDDHDVDLIVIGTRGRGQLARQILGSVTNHLVVHAEIPVHVTPPVSKID